MLKQQLEGELEAV